MMKDYETLYKKIVKKDIPQTYKGPEYQVGLLKKCTILKAVEEIEYSNHSQTQSGYLS